MRRCPKCGIAKSLDDFYRLKIKTASGEYRRYPYCRKCTCAMQNVRYHANKPLVKERVAEEWRRLGTPKAAYLRRTYGISADDYMHHIAYGGGACWICGRVPPVRKTKGGRPLVTALHVDHDHVTVHIRGMLCHSCNIGLGMFMDDPRILSAALHYLKRNLNTGFPPAYTARGPLHAG